METLYNKEEAKDNYSEDRKEFLSKISMETCLILYYIIGRRYKYRNNNVNALSVNILDKNGLSVVVFFDHFQYKLIYNNWSEKHSKDYMNIEPQKNYLSIQNRPYNIRNFEHYQGISAFTESVIGGSLLSSDDKTSGEGASEQNSCTTKMITWTITMASISYSITMDRNKISTDMVVLCS